jgi:hypothetical protein
VYAEKKDFGHPTLPIIRRTAQGEAFPKNAYLSPMSRRLADSQFIVKIRVPANASNLSDS